MEILKLLEEDQEQVANKLSQTGHLNYFKVAPLHVKCSTQSEEVEEEKDAQFYRVKLFKGDIELKRVAKEFNINNGTEYDVKAIQELTPNCYLLPVLDYSSSYVIYDDYICNLEEIFMVQEGQKQLVDADQLDGLTGSKFFFKGSPTKLFRGVFGYILEFLIFLSLHKYGYGGLHPRNILIVHAMRLIQFRGVELTREAKEQDFSAFIHLVCFCEHDGKVSFGKLKDDNLGEEGKYFLLLCEPHTREDDECIRLYLLGFEKDALELMNKHPLFWDAITCINYIGATYALLEACDVISDKPLRNYRRNNYENSMYNFLSKFPAEELTNLRNDILDIDLKTVSDEDLTNVILIMEDIRNEEAHFPKYIRQANSDYPVKYWAFQRARYPGLLVGVHKVMMKYHAKFAYSQNFKDYWKMYYPNAI